METVHQYAKAFALLFAIPFLGWILGLGWAKRMEDEYVGIVQAQPHLQAQHLTPEQIAPLAHVCTENIRNMASFCQTYAETRILENAGFWTGIAALLAIAGIWVAARWCRGSQARLARLFGTALRLILLFVCALVFAQGAILTYTAYLAETLFVGTIHFQLILALGAGTLIASGAVASSIFTLNREFNARETAISVGKEQQSVLWSFVDSIAEKIGAQPPDHIVLGLQPTFYATGAEVALNGTNERLNGETLYLSIPLMRILSPAEFAAVVGHELGHFKGRDTAYSLRFVPVYQGLMDAIDDLAKVPTQAYGTGRLLGLPARAILSFCLLEFAKTERKIGRERELEADKAGAGASSPESLVAALVKSAAFTPIWPQLCNHAVQLLNDGKMYINMSLAFSQHAKSIRQETQSAALVQPILSSRQPHPTDTHPPLEARAQALGVGLGDFEAFLDLQQETSDLILSELEKLEEELSRRHQDRMVSLGWAHPPKPPAEDSAPPPSAFRKSRVI